MKKFLSIVIAVCIMLMLSSCSNSKNELISEPWKTYSNGVVSDITFVKDGNGVWKGDSVFNFIWSLNDNKLTMTYSFLGESKEATYTLMKNDDKYELINETNPEQKLVKASEYVQVVEYYTECGVLPMVNTVVETRQTGMNSNSSNGVIIKQAYTYERKNDTDTLDELLQKYIEKITTDGLIVEKAGTNVYSIYENSLIIAQISIEGQKIEMNIAPYYYKQEMKMEYYSENPSLPKMDTVVLVSKVGQSSSSRNGKTTKMEYKYAKYTNFQNINSLYQEYVNKLIELGFSVENSGNNKAISQNGKIIAEMKFDGENVFIDLAPGMK